MRARLVVGAAALVALGTATGAAVVAAGGPDPGPGQVAEPGEMRKVRAHVVDAPPAVSAARAAGTVARATRQRKPALVYLETAPQTIAPGATGFRVGSCPKRAKAINGYYYMAGTQTSFGLDAQGDSPVRGLRQWAFYLNGGIDGASNVTFGLICLKNVG